MLGVGIIEVHNDTSPDHFQEASLLQDAPNGGMRGVSGRKDLRLLGVELSFRKDPLRLEFGKILELRHGVWRSRRCRLRGVLRLLLSVLLFFLLRPPVLLPA
jgi:hypothetical protein